MIDHKKIHAGLKMFVCDLPGCTSSYTQNAHLRRHLKRTHNIENGKQIDVQKDKDGKPKERSFVCKWPGCTKSYTKNSHLKRHQLSV